MAEYFLDRHVREMTKRNRKFSKAALETMRCYFWPGNIRELDNVIARAVVLGVDEEISTDLLGLGGGKDELDEIDNLPYHEALDRFGTRILEQAMRRSNWSQTKASELLGLQRTYLSRPLKHKGIQQGSEGDTERIL